MNISTHYFAQVYGDDVYGTGTYTCNGVNCQSGQNGSIFAPNTGFFSSGPEVLLPTILIGAVLFAALMLGIKKIIRSRKNRRS